MKLCLLRVTNSPVFPGHVLFSGHVLAIAVFFYYYYYKVMKMSWFSKTGKDQLYSQI